MSEAANDLITIPNQHSSNEVVDFECNICFDLAQDPVITLCGHLHCWPCLYKWLKLHSLSHECPVCKALIQEEKLVPLYGRGKARSDPRSKPVPGLEIPSRPAAGLRPETAPSPAQDNSFSNGVFRQMDRFEPAGFRNFGVLASFGGVLSPALGVQFHGVLNAGGSSLGFHHDGNHGSVRDLEDGYVQTSDEKLKKILYFILFFLLFALLTV